MESLGPTAIVQKRHAAATQAERHALRTHQGLAVCSHHAGRGDRGAKYPHDTRGMETYLLEYATRLRAQHRVDFDRHQGGKK